MEVDFSIDANGILTATATDKATSKSQNIRIENSGGLGKDEIDKMKSDAEAHADEDRKRREVVDLKNRADGMVAQTRRSMEEHGDKVTPDVRGKVESACRISRTSSKVTTRTPSKPRSRRLETASIELGKVVYEAAAAEQGADARGPVRFGRCRRRRDRRGIRDQRRQVSLARDAAARIAETDTEPRR